jgi:hypothetical protein
VFVVLLRDSEGEVTEASIMTRMTSHEPAALHKPIVSANSMPAQLHFTRSHVSGGMDGNKGEEG